MADLSKIRLLCKAKNISLRKLATDIGITDAGLQHILNSNNTSLETLEKLCNALEVPPSYFLDVNIKEDEREFLLAKRILELQEMLNEYMASHIKPHGRT